MTSAIDVTVFPVAGRALLEKDATSKLLNSIQTKLHSIFPSSETWMYGLGFDISCQIVSSTSMGDDGKWGVDYILYSISYILFILL